MHSVWSRLNQMSTTLLSVMSAVAVMLTLTTAYYEFYSGLPEPVVEVSDISVLRLQYDPVEKEEMAAVSVNLHADVSSIWHVNVKVLFLYVIVESTREGFIDEVFIYDHAFFNSPTEITVGPIFEYPLRGPQGTIRGNTFRVKVGWNIIPYTGLIYHQKKHITNFTIPADMDMPTMERRRRGYYH